MTNLAKASSVTCYYYRQLAVALTDGYQLGGGREKFRGGRNLRLKHTSLSSTQANHVM